MEKENDKMNTDNVTLTSQLPLYITPSWDSRHYAAAIGIDITLAAIDER